MRRQKSNEGQRYTGREDRADPQFEPFDNFGSPHDQRPPQEPFETAPYHGRREARWEEDYPFRPRPQPGYRTSDRSGGRTSDDRLTYEKWLQQHEREPRNTEAERQVEGLQDVTGKGEVKAEPRSAKRSVASQTKQRPTESKANRTEAKTRSPRKVNQQKVVESSGREPKAKTSKGETKRRLEDQSEMSKI
jgi:hypothetical protein